ncbi:MAG TPA: hypothetical protein VHG09_05355 [Longimicrobiales bacterium]|nr:hypothetical protein [Longimicrobiales bacterium]
MPILALLALGCVGDRERPGGPLDPGGSARLSVRLLAPETGATVLTGVDITVRVEARDLNALYLDGVGFVARRLSEGAPVVDSAAVRFPSRSDSTHEFMLRIPNSFQTNTQVDIYGIAYGVRGANELSEPVHVTVVQCTDPVCE